MTALGCLGILAGLLVIAASAGFWWAGNLMIGVLEEIGQRDFSAPMQRISHYEGFFESLGEADYKVDHGKPKILEGVTTYFWAVEPKGTGERRVFCWSHDLEANVVEPQTNPALLLDMELNYTGQQEARRYGFYEPKDKVAHSIVRNDFSLLSPTELSWQGSEEQVPQGPVSAPLLNPEEAARRKANMEREQEELEEEPEDEGEQQSENDATEVETPPADEEPSQDSESGRE
ncbi:hypothetical protein IIA79_04600 [bacterium]|nr:hypothetical protein [bacterium]